MAALLTETQEELRSIFREFARKVVEPGAAARDTTGEYHYDLVPRLARTGIFGLPFPEEVGGQGGSTVDFVIALEEVSWADQSVAATVANQVGLSALPVFVFGSLEQKQRWLGPLFRGETLGCFALTEPGGGSDNRGMKTTATRTPRGWRIHGSKMYITNAGTDLTGFLIVAARTGTTADGKPQIGSFIVERQLPAVSVSPPLKKLGWRSSDTREVFFDHVEVPEDCALGDPLTGMSTMMRTLEFGRIQIATLGVGLAQRALDEAAGYAVQRTAFERPIGDNQGVAFKIADMTVGVRAARMLTIDAAARRDRGEPFGDEAAQAKLFASEVAARSAHDCVQIHGGFGFMDETVPARLYRDARVLEIGEGTSEILRMIIARRALGGRN